ncbi:MAG: single-stranded DNA-binding protein [Deltaproteobacteria bacterium]|nr:single-stranded DNA-binding protein [Deltaproteobacteria bacterium]
MAEITDALVEALRPLRFSAPVSHVYNPLEYARKPYEMYWARWGRGHKEVVLIGMNPGPWGMAQTGVPFGEVSLVRDWLRISAPVGTPSRMHPKRPVQGFGCSKSEVSGRRLWGWAKKAFGTPERFFSRFFVANYCPLLFLEQSGRNKTPNTLLAAETKQLFDACDRALRRTIEWISPDFVVGVGAFAEKRAKIALAGLKITIGRVTHPSPANPRANQGWERLVGKELAALGIRV